VPWYHYIWTEQAEEHLAEHDITSEEFEWVLEHAESKAASDSSGRPLVFGYTPDGRYVAAIYELLEDGVTVIPVTCYEVSEP
jgi:uncharacterized DUF497 family protein